MSIAALNQVYDEVRRLTIAGSDLAANDFRLKKLVAPLRKSAAKAPVFGKVADGIENALASTPKDSAQKLLDLGSLVTAILYTQGQTGAKGTLKPLETQNLGLTISATSARVLKPLIEALTTTGSGRLEIVRSAHERGGFKDLRLIKHAVNAIDDPYPELGDYMSEHVLPIYGKAIYPELRASFDKKGKGGHARRLRLMHELDPDKTHELVADALEDGSKEVKLAAIGCLEGRADAVDFLLDQAKSRTKDVRAAAFRSLGSIDHEEVVDALIEGLEGKEVELVARHLAHNPNERLRTYVLEATKKQLDDLLAAQLPRTTKKKKVGRRKSAKKGDREWAVLRLHELLRALSGRNDEATEALLLEAFAKNDEIAGLAGANYISGDDVIERVAQALVLTKSKKALATLTEAGTDVVPNLIAHTFVATALTKKPKAVIDRFGPLYLDHPSGRTKAAQIAQRKSDVVRGAVQDVLRSQERQVGKYHWYYYDTDSSLAPLYETIKLDPGWIDLAIKRDDTQLVLALAQKKSKSLEAFLAGKVDVELKKKTWNPSYDLDDIFRAMLKVGHPKAVPLFVEVMKRACTKQRSYWGTYYLLRVIPALPKKAVAPLEALIPSINESNLDGFVDQLDDLKRKHA